MHSKSKMLRVLFGLSLLAMCYVCSANANCEALKSKIEQKMILNGVKPLHIVLEVVDINKITKAKVVGTCEGRSRKITYVNAPIDRFLESAKDDENRLPKLQYAD